jgi:hypothetical protein
MLEIEIENFEIQNLVWGFSTLEDAVLVGTGVSRPGRAPCG